MHGGIGATKAQLELSRHHLRLELLQQILGCQGRRSWVLTRDEVPIHNGEGLPVADLFESCSETQHFILDQEWYDLGELDLFFLAVCKPGYMLPLDKGFALVSDVTENAWSVAYKRDEFARVVEGLDQCNRIRTLCQVPHGAMSAWIEDRIKCIRTHVGKPQG